MYDNIWMYCTSNLGGGLAAFSLHTLFFDSKLEEAQYVCSYA